MTARDIFGILFWCLCLIGGGLALLEQANTIEKENRQHAIMDNWEKVTAELTSGKIRYKGNNGTITASYTYKYGGLTYTSNNVGLYDHDEAVTLFREKIQFSSYIDCYVNPYNPSEACLFRDYADNSSPAAYTIGGIALIGLGGTLFYFSFIHGLFFKKKSLDSPVQTSSTTSSSHSPRGDVPITSISASPRKIRKQGSLSGVVAKIRSYLKDAKKEVRFGSEKFDMEAVLWMFCICHLSVRDAYAEAARKQGRYISLNSIHVDYLKFDGMSMACAATIQELGISRLTLPELSKLYWKRFAMYQNTKKENHFISFFVALMDKDVSLEDSPRLSVKVLNDFSLPKSNTLLSCILTWMVIFFRNKGVNKLYDCAAALSEDYGYWLVGLKDKINGKTYTGCNGCSRLTEVDKIKNLACPDCSKKLDAYYESRREQEVDGSYISFKINRHCKHCGEEYRERESDIYKRGLCDSCYGQFSKNFDCLRKKHGITKN